MSEIRKNQTEKEKEIMSQLKARIEEIENEMHNDFEYDDIDDGFRCVILGDNLIQYEFWVEDGEIQYEITLFDRWGNEYSVDGSHGRGYQFDQIDEVADLLYNFAF